MVRLNTIAAVGLLAVLLQPAHAEQVFCDLTNRAADAGAFRAYSDRELERYLCIAANDAAAATNAGDSRKIGACTEATRRLLREFERRFPGRDSRSVVGKC
jgi:hypothetical protein